VLALSLAALDLSGVVQLWHVYVLAVGLGIATAVDTPTRQAFVSEMVGADDLANAVSLNSVAFNSSRIVGPALAGLAIAAFGTGWVFLANGLSYAAVIAGLMMMRASELFEPTRQKAQKGQVREGLRYVRERRHLAVPIMLVFMIGTFGLNFQITLALIANDVFHTGASSFGLLTAAFAFGSLLGALGSARRSGPPTAERMLAAALIFGVLEVVVGLAPTFPSMMLLLVPTGAAVLTFTTTANSLVQLGSEAAVRGRVMALYVLVFLGGTPVGAPVVGWVAEHYGPRTSLTVGGAVCVVSALVAARALPNRQRYRYRGAFTRMTL
jgi:MFS family permease